MATMVDIAAAIPTVFDADNHYWEPSDAFTRYRDPAFADRGVRVVERDGKPRYVIGDRLHPILVGPGDAHGRPRPGSFVDYFRGDAGKASMASSYDSEAPSDHPEWFNRDARLRCMDAQGLEAAWLFPSHGVCMEGPMQPDIEASVHILGAFNRWLDDDWGFAYQNRIFGVPFLTLSDLDAAIRELEWCLGRGARVITVRHGPVFTPEGMRSPADPQFDSFWARVAEAGVVVAPHAGFEDGYVEVTDAIARTWARQPVELGVAASSGKFSLADALTVNDNVVQMLMKRRLIHDFAAVVIGHGLFERHPRLKMAYIENGGTWVPSVLHGLQVLHGQNPGMFTRNPVDQFHENCWVAPFVEDSVSELAKHIPVERIVFGSDWPHGEGHAQPKQFFENVVTFSIDDQRRIMVDNARELTLV